MYYLFYKLLTPPFTYLLILTMHTHLHFCLQILGTNSYICLLTCNTLYYFTTKYFFIILHRICYTFYMSQISILLYLKHIFFYTWLWEAWDPTFWLLLCYCCAYNNILFSISLNWPCKSELMYMSYLPHVVQRKKSRVYFCLLLWLNS